MPLIIAERIALSKLRGSRIGRDRFRHQLEDCGKPFRAVPFLPVPGISCLARLNLPDQRVELIKEDLMRVDRPAVYDKRRLGPRGSQCHSSSGDSGQSRSTSASPTSALSLSYVAPSSA